jgi:hypothetical protein
MFKDNIGSITNSLTGVHLALALEKLFELRQPGNESRGEISVILHAFFGFESAVNLIGYEMFFNPNSRDYVDEKQRDWLLRRMLKGWQTISCIEKFEYLLVYRKNELSAKLKARLSELNNLRNMLSHGLAYTTTVLVYENPVTPGIYDVIDSEDSVNWRQKFPNCKFSSIASLDIPDAELALKIVLEALILLSISTDHHFLVRLYYGNKAYYHTVNKDANIDNILKSPE